MTRAHGPVGFGLLAECSPTACFSEATVVVIFSLSRDMSGREIQRELVYIAPAPGLPWFKRAHDGVLGPVKVLRGVAVRRRIATSHVTANETEAQVDPRSAHFQTFFTTLRSSRLNIPDLIEMSTFGHKITPVV
jgi:hypothetical protein